MVGFLGPHGLTGQSGMVNDAHLEFDGGWNGGWEDLVENKIRCQP